MANSTMLSSVLDKSRDETLANINQAFETDLTTLETVVTKFITEFEGLLQFASTQSLEESENIKRDILDNQEAVRVCILTNLTSYVRNKTALSLTHGVFASDMRYLVKALTVLEHIGHEFTVGLGKTAKDMVDVLRADVMEMLHYALTQDTTELRQFETLFTTLRSKTVLEDIVSAEQLIRDTVHHLDEAKLKRQAVATLVTLRVLPSNKYHLLLELTGVERKKLFPREIMFYSYLEHGVYTQETYTQSLKINEHELLLGETTFGGNLQVALQEVHKHGSWTVDLHATTNEALRGVLNGDTTVFPQTANTIASSRGIIALVNKIKENKQIQHSDLLVIPETVLNREILRELEHDDNLHPLNMLNTLALMGQSKDSLDIEMVSSLVKGIETLVAYRQTVSDNNKILADFVLETMSVYFPAEFITQINEELEGRSIFVSSLKFFKSSASLSSQEEVYLRYKALDDSLQDSIFELVCGEEECLYDLSMAIVATGINQQEDLEGIAVVMSYIQRLRNNEFDMDALRWMLENQDYLEAIEGVDLSDIKQLVSTTQEMTKQLKTIQPRVGRLVVQDFALVGISVPPLIIADFNDILRVYLEREGVEVATTTVLASLLSVTLLKFTLEKGRVDATEYRNKVQAVQGYKYIYDVIGDVLPSTAYVQVEEMPEEVVPPLFVEEERKTVQAWLKEKEISTVILPEEEQFMLTSKELKTVEVITEEEFDILLEGVRTEIATYTRAVEVGVSVTLEVLKELKERFEQEHDNPTLHTTYNELVGVISSKERTSAAFSKINASLKVGRQLSTDDMNFLGFDSKYLGIYFVTPEVVHTYLMANINDWTDVKKDELNNLMYLVDQWYSDGFTPTTKHFELLETYKGYNFYNQILSSFEAMKPVVVEKVVNQPATELPKFGNVNKPFVHIEEPTEPVQVIEEQPKVNPLFEASMLDELEEDNSDTGGTESVLEVQAKASVKHYFKQDVEYLQQVFSPEWAEKRGFKRILEGSGLYKEVIGKLEDSLQDTLLQYSHETLQLIFSFVAVNSEALLNNEVLENTSFLMMIREKEVSEALQAYINAINPARVLVKASVEEKAKKSSSEKSLVFVTQTATADSLIVPTEQGSVTIPNMTLQKAKFKELVVQDRNYLIVIPATSVNISSIKEMGANLVIESSITNNKLAFSAYVSTSEGKKSLKRFASFITIEVRKGVLLDGNIVLENDGFNTLTLPTLRYEDTVVLKLLKTGTISSVPALTFNTKSTYEINVLTSKGVLSFIEDEQHFDLLPMTAYNTVSAISKVIGLGSKNEGRLGEADVNQLIKYGALGSEMGSKYEMTKYTPLTVLDLYEYLGVLLHFQPQTKEDVAEKVDNLSQNATEVKELIKRNGSLFKNSKTNHITRSDFAACLLFLSKELGYI